MTTPLKTIDQAGYRAVVDARIEHPERYADKPLFIWQADDMDGIHTPLVMNALYHFNKDRAKGEERHIMGITVHDPNTHLKVPHPNGQPIAYIIAVRDMPLGEYLSTVGRLIEENASRLPMIVYLPFRYQSIDLPGEQLLSQPDFEVWASESADSLIPDFIRGDGSEAGITYRWYNRYNDPGRGCFAPDVWHSVSARLRLSIRFRLKVPMGKKLDYPLCNAAEFGEEFIRSAFEVEASKGHISDDVINDFVKYMKTMANKNNLIHPHDVSGTRI